MIRVVAQGTFDLLHPGHLHYLEEAASMGDELRVIVARGDNVTHKPEPVVPDAQRREMVAALDPVDVADAGIDCEVERASAREPDSESVLSTGSIIERVCRRRC